MLAEVSLHTEGPAISQVEQGFPWFSSVLDQMLSWFSNASRAAFSMLTSKCHPNLALPTLITKFRMKAVKPPFKFFPRSWHKKSNSQPFTFSPTYLYQKDERALPENLRSSNSFSAPDRGVGFRVPVGPWIFFFPYRLDWFWGPPSLLSNGYRRLVDNIKISLKDTNCGLN
jgi:hypothetical protein